jgi:hypothetical protein
MVLALREPPRFARAAGSLSLKNDAERSDLFNELFSCK